MKPLTQKTDAWLIRLDMNPVPYESDQGLDLVRQLSRQGEFSCPYTVLRTSSSGQAVEFETHFQRLLLAAESAGNSTLPTREEFSRLIEKVNSAIQTKGAVVVVVVVAEDGRLYAHAKPVKQQARKPAHANVILASRKHGAIKSSDWIFERENLIHDAKTLSQTKAEDTLLMNSKGGILEGTSSNFFVVTNDTIQTAVNDVLHGSIRKIVLDTISRNCIPLNLTPPNWNERSAWQDAFITSTSRMVLPLSSITDQDGVTVTFDNRHHLVTLLKEEVEAQVT